MSSTHSSRFFALGAPFLNVKRPTIIEVWYVCISKCHANLCGHCHAISYWWSCLLAIFLVTWAVFHRFASSNHCIQLYKEWSTVHIRINKKTFQHLPTLIKLSGLKLFSRTVGMANIQVFLDWASLSKTHFGFLLKIRIKMPRLGPVLDWLFHGSIDRSIDCVIDQTIDDQSVTIDRSFDRSTINRSIETTNRPIELQIPQVLQACACQTCNEASIFLTVTFLCKWRRQQRRRWLRRRRRPRWRRRHRRRRRRWRQKPNEASTFLNVTFFCKPTPPFESISNYFRWLRSILHYFRRWASFPDSDGAFADRFQIIFILIFSFFPNLKF